MFLKRTSGSERHSTTLNPIAQGLCTLHNVACRDIRSSEQRLRQACHGLRKSALANSYRKMNASPAVPSLRGFEAETEEMRRAFFARPGCPQFCTKATSVSHLDTASSIDLPRLGVEDWLLGRQDSDRSVDGQVLGSKSACELSLRRRSSAQTLSPVSSSTVPSQRLPWYISVIHEKERSLLVLGEEVRRFSELEGKLQEKDQEILALQREMEALRKQLKCILRSKGLETSPFPSRRESPLEDGLALGRLSFLKPHMEQEDLQLPEQPQEEDTQAEFSRELSLQLGGGEEDQAPGAEPKVAGDGGARDSAGRAGIVQEEAAADEERGKELEEDDEEEDLTQEGDSSWGRGFSMTESFEDELLAQLEEYERLMLEFHSELDATRIGYCLAVGTTGSLQRQLAYQESQMGKVVMENEALQKELRERKQQLQAMSDKFSRLREDKKHLEMMGHIEKDNLDLRQRVSDLESELAKRDLTIAEMISKVSELQAQLSLEQEHVQRWKQLQEDVRSRNEAVQQSEQQARVALESAQARLERLRSRIIQAAFSVTGVKALATEISDSDILEALQRVISERNDYYQQLKQTGVKVPPPQQVEILPSKSKKTLPK
ncbi:PREDICTED: coiled-coil domain-containing protein 27 isoform X2 [Chinchilla lanigera]|uniref:coiled-coil domain-containing protein 27 isoform X2 n=1 Tax=Chinchilla lanigera TaxID=34839 RepID=UPI00038F0535|nr:PREDICTED: coiled-coil domain-containing protein 27 isoform X2 [Chinchilla lanigera]